MIATHQDNGEELFPIVDPEGRIIGHATRKECHGGSMLLHPVVHLHVFNSKGELSGAFAFGGADEQANRLRADGIAVINNRVDLEKYGMKF